MRKELATLINSCFKHTESCLQVTPVDKRRAENGILAEIHKTFVSIPLRLAEGSSLICALGYA